MTIREHLEQLENENLSPYAAHSVNSKGRLRAEEHVISDRYFKETGTESFIVRHFED